MDKRNTMNSEVNSEATHVVDVINASKNSTNFFAINSINFSGVILVLVIDDGVFSIVFELMNNSIGSIHLLGFFPGLSYVFRECLLQTGPTAGKKCAGVRNIL